MQMFTPREYLKIDISNNFGLDKLNWDERIKWFDANEYQLHLLVDKAETPALFYAGVQAWNQVKQGQPIGYPIGLDGTASGLQLLSCLTRDDIAGRLCNIIDTGNREDAYNQVYRHMLQRLGGNAQLHRDDTKRAILTSLYGSTAVPKEVFGEGSKMLDTFYKTMAEVAPNAWKLNQIFLDIWRSDIDQYSWVMPDNFHVIVKVMAPVQETVHFLNGNYEVVYQQQMAKDAGRSLGANICHSLDGLIVREICRRCMFDPKQINDVEVLLFTCWDLPNQEENSMCEVLWNLYLESGFLSARILDYITPTTIGLVDRTVIEDLITSLPSKPFEVVTVHDCFRVLPSYGNDIRKQYNHLLAMITKSDMLQFLMSQYLEKEVNLSLGNDDMWKTVAQANYALS